MGTRCFAKGVGRGGGSAHAHAGGLLCKIPWGQDTLRHTASPEGNQSALGLFPHFCIAFIICHVLGQWLAENENRPKQGAVVRAHTADRPGIPFCKRCGAGTEGRMLPLDQVCQEKCQKWSDGIKGRYHIRLTLTSCVNVWRWCCFHCL